MSQCSLNSPRVITDIHHHPCVQEKVKSDHSGASADGSHAAVLSWAGEPAKQSTSKLLLFFSMWALVCLSITRSIIWCFSVDLEVTL